MAITWGLSGVRDGFVLNSEQYQQWTYYKEFEQLKDIIDDQYYKPVNSESLYDGALKGLSRLPAIRIRAITPPTNTRRSSRN